MNNVLRICILLFNFVRFKVRMGILVNVREYFGHRIISSVCSRSA